MIGFTHLLITHKGAFTSSSNELSAERVCSDPSSAVLDAPSMKETDLLVDSFMKSWSLPALTDWTVLDGYCYLKWNNVRCSHALSLWKEELMIEIVSLKSSSFEVGFSSSYSIL